MARTEGFPRRSSTSGRYVRAAPRPQRELPSDPVLVRLLIDHSVWGRLESTPAVAEALRALVNAAGPSSVYICPPAVAEYGLSARNGADHTRLMTRLASFIECPVAPTSQDVLSIQNALWNGGLFRAVGATDTAVAAYGIVNSATVVHYDGDYDHVATVVPGFRHRWILPRGTV